jgi:hypothetical protein
MQYFLCPRCQFRVPATKHVCQTCGFKIPSAKSTTSGASSNGDGAVKLTNPFAKMLGFNKQKEAGSEKPALG